MTYEDLLRRASSQLGVLVPPEVDDARRVAAIARELGSAFDRGARPALDETANVRLRIELRGLAERLGRRAADAIPFASLARALSADLHESPRDAARIREECDVQLATHGL